MYYLIMIILQTNGEVVTYMPKYSYHECLYVMAIYEKDYRINNRLIKESDKILSISCERSDNEIT